MQKYLQSGQLQRSRKLQPTAPVPANHKHEKIPRSLWLWVLQEATWALREATLWVFAVALEIIVVVLGTLLAFAFLYAIYLVVTYIFAP